MTTLQIIGLALLIGGVLGYVALFLWVLTADKRKARKEGDMLEVLGRIGLAVCLCGYAALLPANVGSTESGNMFMQSP